MNVRSSLARAFPRLRPRRQPQRQSALLQQQPQCRASSSFFFGHRQVAAAEADQHQQHQAQVLSPSSSSDSIQMNHMSAGSPSSNPEAPFTASSTHEPLNAAAATAATAGASFNSVNSSEIAHFSRLSSQWWDERGEFAFLHRMNPVRMEFVREKVMRGEMDDEGWSFEKRDRVGSDGKIIESKSDAKVDAGKWLRGMDVLDVGCGGGLLTEVRPEWQPSAVNCRRAQRAEILYIAALQSLARVGGRALGIDASAENIAIASTHASQDPLLPFTTEGTAATGDGPSLSYRQIAAEDLQCEGKRYDLVCSMEVLEHVDAPGEFLKCLGDMVKVRQIKHNEWVSPKLLRDRLLKSRSLYWIARRSPRLIDHLPYAFISPADDYDGGKHPPSSDTGNTHV